MSRVKKILVVDDNPVDRHLVGSLLGKIPSWQIEFAVDGAAALSQIATSNPDIIVTDMRMPYVDGLELVKKVREDHSHIPVMLITSQGSEKNRRRSVEVWCRQLHAKISAQPGLGTYGETGPANV